MNLCHQGLASYLLAMRTQAGIEAKIDRELRQRQGGVRRSLSLSLSCFSVSTLYLYLSFLFLFSACTSAPQESSKALVKIDNVTLSRLDDKTLRVTMNYDLEAGVKLPLPYKSVLVFPLEPRGKLAGQVPTIEFSSGLIALDLEIPSDAGFTWQDLAAKDACCTVSLKGEQDASGSYERISNSVTIALPQFSG